MIKILAQSNVVYWSNCYQKQKRNKTNKKRSQAKRPEPKNVVASSR